MPGWRDIDNIWTTFKQLDVRPIQAEAEQPLTLAFVGEEGVGKSALIAALRLNARQGERIVTPAIEADLYHASDADSADLIVLVLDATRRDFSAEAKLYSEWQSAKRNVLVFYNKMDATLLPANRGEETSSAIAVTNLPWSNARFAFGSALDPDLLQNDFVPRVLDALPNQHLALARRYPLFRYVVSRRLIADTALANASYSFGTGLAEIVPVLDITFNVADILILTKNQGIMVYKMGLALGLSPRWQDQFAQLGGVIGAGFLWRQVARELVGLIPGWGILPKVAIAYAGTYAVGEAVVYWYKTGHKISKEAMRQAYADALGRGKEIAQNLLSRAPRLELPRASLPALRRAGGTIVCLSCGKENASDAKFCNDCGTALG